MKLLFTLGAAATMSISARATSEAVIDRAMFPGSPDLSILMEVLNAIADVPEAAKLMAAVTATEPLSEPINFFAPQDDAFAAIVDELGSLSPLEVIQLLEAHIVPGACDVDCLTERMKEAHTEPVTMTTLSGTDLEVSTEVLESALIDITPSGTDIVATYQGMTFPCAGVLYEIDAVLLPASLTKDPPGTENPSLWVAFAHLRSHLW